MADDVRHMLNSVGLDSLWQNFEGERIDTLDLCKGLQDRELTNLGLVTIGDKVRFRSVLQETAKSTIHSEHSVETRNQARPGNGTSERNLLFMPTRSREMTRLSSKKKKGPGRTWTTTFLCLSDNNQITIPNSAEKECLFKAGLGLKKITFNANDSESEVHATIIREFPKLADIGGFEIMCCTSSCRTLKKINCKWDVKILKSVVGPQARFYIRPIQSCLSVEDTRNEENESNLEITCKTCEKKFHISQIREHIAVCPENSNLLRGNNHSGSATPQVQLPVDENSHSLRNSASETTEVLLFEGENHHSASETHLVQESSGQDDEDLPDLMQSVINYVFDNEQQAHIQTSTLTKSCIDEIASLNIQDPIHILRYLQNKIVTGRKLDLESDDIENGNVITGETNFIVIDRHRLLETAIENISSIENFRLTLEVQFSDEVAADFGGPRKEFFSLVLGEIYEKFFDPIKDYLAEDYETVGQIFALSMLQNGKLPRIFNEAFSAELLSSSPSKPFSYLKKGMNALGLIEIIKAYPILLHLLTPEHRPPLSLKMLTHLLQPQFSAVGSNQRVIESIVYQKFIKYMREVAGRRENVTLGQILSFVTGVDEEPPLGFSISPTLMFAERLSYLPTSNTCTNNIIFTVPKEQRDLPEDEHLLSMFDYAFCNSYFGLA